jgi:hypothetical protein
VSPEKIKEDTAVTFAPNGMAQVDVRTQAGAAPANVLKHYRCDISPEMSIQRLDMVGFGCTSQSQAIRAGRWALYTEQQETDVVMFTTGLEGAYVNPGDIIKVMDATVVSLTTLIIPIVAPLLGCLVLHETVPPLDLAGIATIQAGVAVGTLTPARRRPGG